MLIFLWIIIWIIIILFSITIHELGHFIALKKMNVYVHEFSIGFGPKIFSWGKGETKYYLRAIPLGGYVIGASKLSKDVFPDIIVQKSRLIDALPYYKKIIFTLAGIFVNISFALLISLLYFVIKYDQITSYGEFLENGVIGFFVSFISVFNGSSPSIANNITIASSFNFHQSIGFVIFLLMFINFNLAFLNVIPFPPLDGWKGAEFTYESITKKEIKENARITITMIGMACLVIFTIFSFISPYI